MRGGRVLTVLVLAHSLVAEARAQGVPRLLDAAWMGFNTGYFGDGFGPTSLAAGDLDGDGDADLVVGQGYFGGPGVSILLAWGDDTYAPARYVPLPMNDSVGRVALGDVDGDGDLDVLATIPDTWTTGDRVALWRNDGSAGLSAVEIFLCGTAPLDLVLADINGDGHADLLTADSGAGSVSLLRHNGLSGAAAGFLAAQAIAVGPSPLALSAGDLDGDGLVDIAVTRGDPFVPAVTLLFNNGSGGFRAPLDLAAGVTGGPVVALGDMDNDGDLDLVVGREETANRAIIRVLHNDGKGVFSTPVDTLLDGNSPHPADFALADLDGNGYLDVVAATPNTRFGDGFRVMLSDGLGAYRPIAAYPATMSSEAVLTLDADGDGDVDVLTVGRYAAAVTVARNPGDGIFPMPVPYAVSGFALDIDAADIDGDGDLDIATAASAVEIHRNLGGGFFAPAVTISPAMTMDTVKLRDLDGDKLVDLLLGPDSFPGFLVARGRGDGSFDPARSWPFACGGPVDAFDLDGDGDLDVVMPACSDGFNDFILVARNDGNLSFSLMPDLPMQVSGNRIEAADLDGDGKLDLVTNESGYGLATFHGNGDLTFGPEVLTGGTPPLRFALGDFNGDLKADAGVVVGQGSFGTDFAGVALGVGDGTFAAPTALEPGSSTLDLLKLTEDLDAGDLDCDGIADLVTTSYASSDIAVFRSNHDGTLAQVTRYGAGVLGMVSVLGDFTGDGRLDVATVAEPLSGPVLGSALLILPGRCPCTVPDLPPPDQGNVLRAVKQGDDVVLSWTATGAARFRVFRDDAKTMIGLTRLPPDVSAVVDVDGGRVPGIAIDFYRVRGLSCGDKPGP